MSPKLMLLILLGVLFPLYAQAGCGQSLLGWMTFPISYVASFVNPPPQIPVSPATTQRLREEGIEPVRAGDAGLEKVLTCAPLSRRSYESQYEYIVQQAFGFIPYYFRRGGFVDERSVGRAVTLLTNDHFQIAGQAVLRLGATFREDGSTVFTMDSSFQAPHLRAVARSCTPEQGLLRSFLRSARRMSATSVSVGDGQWYALPGGYHFWSYSVVVPRDHLSAFARELGDILEYEPRVN